MQSYQGEKSSALDATLVNGTASHALDFDGLSGTPGGHQSVPLVSMLFALAEERKGRGDDLIAAYVIGVETEIRLARAVDAHDLDKGWHPACTLGAIAAVAAASNFLKLGQERTAVALAIAASLASGIKADVGAMTKPLHAGQCGRGGASCGDFRHRSIFDFCNTVGAKRTSLKSHQASYYLPS